MDQMIVSEAGMSIPAMFEKFGESCFRGEKETQMLRDSLGAYPRR